MQEHTPRPKDNPQRISRTLEDKYRDDMLTLAYMTSSKFGAGIDVTPGHAPVKTDSKQSDGEVESSPAVEQMEFVVQQGPVDEPESVQQQVTINPMQAIAQEFIPSLQERVEFSEGPPPQDNVPYDIPEEVSIGTGFSVESEGLQSFASDVALQPLLSTREVDVPGVQISEAPLPQMESLFVEMQPVASPQPQADPPTLSSVVVDDQLSTFTIADDQQELQQLPVAQQPVPAPSIQEIPATQEIVESILDFPIPDVGPVDFVGQDEAVAFSQELPQIGVQENVYADIPQASQPKIEPAKEPEIRVDDPYAFLDGPQIKINPAYSKDAFEQDMNTFGSEIVHRQSLDDLQDASKDYLDGINTILALMVEQLREARSRLIEIETALDRRYSR